MAITTFTELKTTLTTILNTDDADTLSLLDYAISQVEHRLNNDPDFRISQMAQAWEATIDQEYAQMPPDVLSIRRVSTSFNGRTYTPEYFTPEQATDFPDDPSYPHGYTIVADWFQLVPPPNGEYVIRVDYWKRLTPLSLTVPSNWLLEDYSHIYMSGALAELYLIMLDEERATIQNQRFTDFVQKLKSADNMKRYSGNSLTVKVR